MTIAQPTAPTAKQPATPASAADREVLEAFYHATDGANWLDSGNWLSDTPLGEWYGVDTDAEGRVTRLALYDNGLSGSIPAELGQLSSLQELALSGNELSGCVPEALLNVAFSDTVRLGLPVC